MYYYQIRQNSLDVVVKAAGENLNGIDFNDEGDFLSFDLP
jgi:hypothetical protein